MPKAENGSRIAFVVPRYGETVLGGAETLCRELAENLRRQGGDVEVLTTCADDHFTWRNVLPEGRDDVGGVPVHRFRVSERDHERWWNLHSRIALCEHLSYTEQLEWMANSVWSESLVDAVGEDGGYDWIVALPYLFGTTFWCTAARPERTVLIPCLHDEPHARLPAVGDMLGASAGCLANTETERRFIASLAPSSRSHVVGVGFKSMEPPGRDEVDRFCAKRGIEPGYLLYAGRREEAKGLPSLFADYAAFRRDHGGPSLALMGSGSMPIPSGVARDVIDLGFVPDAEKHLAYAAASVLVHPSHLESLGMVLMEAWRAGTPVLVSAGSAVLVSHCQASGGGLWYSGPEEFAEALDVLLNDAQLRQRAARNGAGYVREQFYWEAVRGRFYGALDEWAA